MLARERADQEWHQAVRYDELGGSNEVETACGRAFRIGWRHHWCSADPPSDLQYGHVTHPEAGEAYCPACVRRMTLPSESPTREEHTQ